MEKQIEKLEIINSKKNWVIEELGRLVEEWENWQEEVALIKDHSYDKNSCSEAYADGEENMEKHKILQGKTLTFLNNNIKGHGFIKGFDGKSIDRSDLRLSFRVKHRLTELRILKDSLQYALREELKEHTEDQKRILDELAEFLSEIEEIPSKFGIINGMGSNFDYQRGKLRFDSWLKRFTGWMLTNIPGSESDVKSLKCKYHDNNCRPSGSGYGTNSQMVNTVFVQPFTNTIHSIQEDILSGRFEAVHKSSPSNALQIKEYVSQSRIDELSNLNGKYDYSKLILLLIELNKAYKNQMYYSVGCLIRAIIDHIPPVFDCKNFNEVANNYKGSISTSFKESMKALNEQMRKVTDSYLHTQIREKEVAPVEQQVEARSALDFLLSEIIRVT